MKVVVCTIPSKKNYMRIGRCGGSMKAGEKWPPIKLMYVAAVARKHGDCKFLDGATLSMNKSDFLSEIRSYNPDLVVTEPTLPSLEHELSVIDEIKNMTDSKVAIIGGFIENQPNDIFETSKVDYIIQGEAEGVIEDLVKQNNLDSIKGLWYRTAKSVKFNGPRKFIEDLDSLPLPPHDLIPLNEYSSFFMKDRPIHTSNEAIVKDYT